MAIRVQTQADIGFGNAGAQVTMTHVRVRRVNNPQRPIVKQLVAPVVVLAGSPMQLPSGLLDIVYPAGDLGNTHMRGLVDPYWNNVTMQVDMLTDANTVVAVAGYSQQTYSNWAISEEADPVE